MSQKATHKIRVGSGPGSGALLEIGLGRSSEGDLEASLGALSLGPPVSHSSSADDGTSSAVKSREAQHPAAREGRARPTNTNGVVGPGPGSEASKRAPQDSGWSSPLALLPTRLPMRKTPAPRQRDAVGGRPGWHTPARRRAGGLLKARWELGRGPAPEGRGDGSEPSKRAPEEPGQPSVLISSPGLGSDKINASAARGGGTSAAPGTGRTGDASGRGGNAGGRSGAPRSSGRQKRSPRWGRPAARPLTSRETGSAVQAVSKAAAFRETVSRTGWLLAPAPQRQPPQAPGGSSHTNRVPAPPWAVSAPASSLSSPTALEPAA